ncbi:hypothetical protein Kpho02_73850 [Kitasatospora phosalacinea]|uniref:Uncharacterized protein n=1 Tax=Kitasatospora phosalacinea TaxID=2065 RepID=A0A9W6QHM0_9ACTN|nr:hypothetical protein Kpho02_73850 [Kitasatospora phosalacinea]
MPSPRTRTCRTGGWWNCSGAEEAQTSDRAAADCRAGPERPVVDRGRPAESVVRGNVPAEGGVSGWAVRPWSRAG